MPAGPESTTGPIFGWCDHPRSTTPVSIGVLADPHVAPDENGTWKVYHRTETHLETALDISTRSGVDYILVAGDLTKSGSPSQYSRFEELLDDCPLPWNAIPGNHDVPKSYNGTTGLSPSAFVSRYGDGSGFPWVRRIGDTALIGINSVATSDGTLQETWGGVVGQPQLDWLDSQLPRLSQPIVFVHHNCGPLPEHPEAGNWNRFALENAAEFVTCCERHGVSMILSAHHHVPVIRRLGSVTEVISPALCSFPNAFLVLRIAAHGTAVQFVPVTDKAGLRESYAAARDGKPLGRGILSLVENRF